MATTAASVPRPASVCSIRTRSSNSNGKVERKIACCEVPNSNTVASLMRRFPARSCVTWTGMRTAVTDGKKRANCSAQLNSPTVSVSLPDLLTSPRVILAYRVCSLAQREDTPDAVKDAKSQRVSCTQDAKSMKKGNHVKVKKLQGLVFVRKWGVAQASHAETSASHFLEVMPCR